MGYLKILVLLIFLFLLGIFSVNIVVEQSCKKHIYTSSQEIPYNKVGLLLGTSKYLINGNINLYYSYRIDAAVALFEAKKIDFILVSGDNSTKEYNEPSNIKKDLLARGIPANRIYLDYAGFRTLDSVVRSKAVFGQNSISIISQKFHNERALFIANMKNIDAVAFNAKDVSMRYGYKIQLREKLARVKMFLDLIFGKEPKFFGDKIEIE